MTKRLVWHVVSASLLAAFIEFYIWSQSTVLNWDANWIKAVLVCCYFLIAIGAQVLFSYLNGYSAVEAAGMNAVVSATVCAWLTVSAFVFHPGLAKGEDLRWFVVLRVFWWFFITVGLATFVARYLVAMLMRGRMVPRS